MGTARRASAAWGRSRSRRRPAPRRTRRRARPARGLSARRGSGGLARTGRPPHDARPGQHGLGGRSSVRTWGTPAPRHQPLPRGRPVGRRVVVGRPGTSRASSRARVKPATQPVRRYGGLHGHGATSSCRNGGSSASPGRSPAERRIRRVRDRDVRGPCRGARLRPGRDDRDDLERPACAAPPTGPARDSTASRTVAGTRPPAGRRAPRSGRTGCRPSAGGARPAGTSCPRPEPLHRRGRASAGRCAACQRWPVSSPSATRRGCRPGRGRRRGR